MSDILSDLESINGVDGFDPRDAIRICQEAADEIERLTRELETRTNSLKSLGESYAPLVQERDRLTREREALDGNSLRIFEIIRERDRLRAALSLFDDLRTIAAEADPEKFVQVFLHCADKAREALRGEK